MDVDPSASRRIGRPPVPSEAAKLERAGLPGRFKVPGSTSVGERRAVTLVYLAGVSAGIALGRFIPLEAALRDDFGLSLTAFGWLVSGVTVVAACLALPAGLWVARQRLGGVLSVGLGVMVLAGLLEVTAPTVLVLYGARVLEGVGFLAVVVTGPLLLTATCGPATRRGALALWSTFVPVGMGAASAIGTLSGTVGWRAAGALTLIPAVAALGGALWWLTGIRDRPQEAQARQGGQFGPVLQLSLSFCLISLLGVAAVALLPNLAVDRNVPAALGGATAAIASLAGVPGGLLAGVLLGRGAAPRTLIWAVLAMPCAAAVMYQATPWAAVAAGAAALQFAGGTVLAVLYACMPLLAPSPYELGRGYGLLNQMGSIGSLLGPPGLGYAVTRAGWSYATILVAAVTLAGLLLFLAATRRPALSAR